jgi:dihydroflavonol-4-reductase
METVLLTGGRSFIGGHICRVLVKRGYHVILHSTCAAQFDNLKDLLPHPHVTPVMCSYGETQRLAEVLSKAQYMIFSSVPPGFQSLGQGKVKERDLANLKLILDLLAASSIKKSVFISTCSTIGKVSEGLGDENSLPPKKQGWAAIAFKLKLENLVVDYFRKGLNVVIVNPTMLVGDYDSKPSTGEFFRFVDKAPFTFLDGAKINFVDVADAALGTVLALEKGRAGERYILGGVNTVQEDIVKRIRECGGKKMPSIAIPYFVAVSMAGISEFINLIMRRERPFAPLLGIELSVHGNQHLSCEKAKRELGFVPGDTWSAVDRAYRWYKNHGLLSK